MKKIAILVAIAALVASVGAAPAEAGKRKAKRVERVVEGSYASPVPGVSISGDFYGACLPTRQVGCVTVAPQPGELFTRIAIEDATGQPVHAFITDEEGGAPMAEFCGTTPETVFLGSSEPFLVWVFAGPCGDGSPAAATSGTVTATLSNRP